MPINTGDDYRSSAKQSFTWCKTASKTVVANIPFSVFDLAGDPGAGTMAIGNTANGVVPTDATNGYPIIASFAPGATGHLTNVVMTCSVPCRILAFDRLFAAGAYNFNDNITLASQPSFASRVPNGDYKGLELWMEAVTAFTGNQSIRIQYLDQDGNAGDTGTIATGVAPTQGRMYRMPLAAGDNGISQLNVVTSSVSTVGTFNMMILRRLAEGRIPVVNGEWSMNIFRTGGKRVYDNSALYFVIIADGTSSGSPSVTIEIASL